LVGKMDKRKDYHNGNGVRVNEVGSDGVTCFKEVRINWKENINEVCQKVAAINVNEVIKFRPNLMGDFE
jgi:hypothetical protein